MPSFVEEDVDDVIPSQYLPEANNSISSFVRNVRGWVTYLMSALLRVASFQEHKFILLHLIRYPLPFAQ